MRASRIATRNGSAYVVSTEAANQVCRFNIGKSDWLATLGAQPKVVRKRSVHVVAALLASASSRPNGLDHACSCRCFVLIAQVVNDLYVVTVPYVGGETPTISVADPDAASFPARKLTDIGGQFPNWSADGREVHWSIGNAHVVYDLDAAQVYDDSVAAAEPMLEKLLTVMPTSPVEPIAVAKSEDGLHRQGWGFGRNR